MSEEEQPLAVRVDLWRQAAIKGTITDDQLRMAVNALRERRVMAATVTAKAKKGPTKSADEMLDDLENL